MKLVALSLAFCAAALCLEAAPQTTSLDVNKMKAAAERLKTMALATAEPKTCAIPLLNALPANTSVEYKMRIVKPNMPAEQTAKTAQQRLGIPACKSTR